MTSFTTAYPGCVHVSVTGGGEKRPVGAVSKGAGGDSKKAPRSYEMRTAS